MKTSLLYCVLALVLGASTCNNKAPKHLTDISDLKDTRWLLTELSGNPVNLPVGSEAYITLNTEQKRVLGSGGCNQLRAAMAVDGDKLLFSKIGSTKKLCPEHMDTEKGFLKALEDTARFKLDKDVLHLLNESGTEIATLIPHAKQ